MSLINVGHFHTALVKCLFGFVLLVTKWNCAWAIRRPFWSCSFPRHPSFRLDPGLSQPLGVIATATPSYSLPTLTMTQSELYKIALRDTTFTLDRSQIEFDSPNYFTSCFLGSFSESHAREIRLSRDPALFSIIVNYLSGYAILPIQPPMGMSEQATLENLLRDALFYGLDELAGMLEEHKMEGKALRAQEERVIKSYAMIVWPQGMGSRKGHFMVRLSESQAHVQCHSHSLLPGTVPLLQSTGIALVNQLLKEQKITARSWTWAAFWTTMKSTNHMSGPRVDNDCAVLEITELIRE
ncbi:hypothetical protein RSAG8_05577, partial [Rhizoctonia solani AG-8 WAC10335]